MAPCLWRGRLLVAGLAIILSAASTRAGLVQDAPSRVGGSAAPGRLSGHLADSARRQPVDDALASGVALLPASVPLSRDDLSGPVFLRSHRESVMTDWAPPEGALVARVPSPDSRTSAARSIEVADGVRPAELNVGPASGPTRIVVPEPSVLLLMLLGLPVVLRGRGRFQRTRTRCAGADLT
jgi:hypothetical protein